MAKHSGKSSKVQVNRSNTGYSKQSNDPLILSEPSIPELPTAGKTVISGVVANRSKSSIPSPGAMMPSVSKKPENLLTTSERMEIIKKGIPKNGLEEFKLRIGFDYNRLATILATTRVTLLNKKGTETFSSVISERILSLADIYAYGYEVFENEANFNNWILTNNKALDGKAPAEFMDNQFGREEIKNLIGRIDYGIYS